MVEWIVKRAQGDRARVGTLTGVVCILANVALCAAKGVIGVLSGSVSIVADAMNNLSDASSNIVSVLGFKLASMRLRIHAMAQEIDSRLSIHDLRCVPGPTHTNVIFDCVRPSDLQMSAEDVKHALTQRVESEYPKSIAKITIDEDYVGHTHE